MSEMTQSPDILAALDVHKYYGRGLARMHVLRGVNLSVRRGEFLAIMGPSGCGKSTLLHVLGLMTPAEEGSQVLLDGVALPEDEHGRTHLRRTQIGFVFQRFNLLGVLSAADNVAISLRVRGIAANGRARELFERLRIAHVMDRRPGQMSIGEQQRVAVVRRWRISLPCCWRMSPPATSTRPTAANCWRLSAR